MPKDLQDSLSSWLKDSGYVLEMTVARGLTAAGFEVLQADYHEDIGTNKLRETDVTGYVSQSSQHSQVTFSLVVECKSSGEKPWVLFTYDHHYSQNLSVVRRATNRAGASILASLQFNPQVQELTLFGIPPRAAYGIALGLRKPKEPDTPYMALNSVCGAALGFIKRLSNVTSQIQIPFAWPILVTRAKLYDCFLGEDNEPVLVEINKGTLIWKNPVLDRHTIVQIYTEKAFLNDAQLLYRDAVSFIQLAVEENDRSPRVKESRNTIDE
jgi:hypothetical protein